MAKIYHCAKCGTQLEFCRKAIRGGTIYNLISPHECGEVKELKDFEAVELPPRFLRPKPEAKLNKLFDSFPFVDKINKASPKPIPDSRPKDNLRQELKSTAPPDLVRMAKNFNTSSVPGRELEEPNGDAD